MDFMETDYYRMDEENFKSMVDTHYELNKPKEVEEAKNELDQLSETDLKLISGSGRKSPRRSPSPKSKQAKAVKQKRDEDEKYAWVDGKKKSSQGGKLDLTAGAPKNKKIPITK